MQDPRTTMRSLLAPVALLVFAVSPAPTFANPYETKLANGLLTIELQREIPEEKKPRAIPVQAGNGQPALTH